VLERDPRTERDQHRAGGSFEPPREGTPCEPAARVAGRDRQAGVPECVEDDDERGHQQGGGQRRGPVIDELGEERNEEHRKLRVGK
jgi:hypothetical protein